jgi:hypothetical protein
LTFLDHEEASNASSNDEPLGGNAGRASGTGVRGDGRRAASGVCSANAASAGSDTGHLGALGRTILAKPVGGCGDGEGDGQRREVCVLGDGDSRGVLDDGWGAGESGDGRLLDGLGRGDVGSWDGLGDGGGERSGDGGGAGPDGGAGHVAVVVDAALGADGGVDAGQLGGGDVRDRGGRRVRGRGAGLVGGAGLLSLSGGAGGRGDRAAGRSRSSGRGGSAAGGRAGGNRAVLALGVALDGIGNVPSSLGGVQLEVVGVSLDGVSTKARSADEVVDVAVVLESGSVGIETSETSGIAVAVGLASASVQGVVGLVGSVPGVAEQSDGSDVAADARLGLGQTGVSPGRAEDIAAVASKNVAEDGGALGVTAEHDGRLGALGVVCIDLLQREELTSGNGRAVVGGVSIVGNVLVVTAHAREVGTNGGGEVALTAGVWGGRC